MTQTGRLLCVAALLVLFGSGRAQAAALLDCAVLGEGTSLSGCVSVDAPAAVAGGFFDYAFRLSNTSSALSVFFLDLIVPDFPAGGATAADASAPLPVGWFAPDAGPTRNPGWLSTDAAFDLLPGSALDFIVRTNFSATEAEIGAWEFSVGTNPFDVPNPNPVPEPGTLLLLGSGLAGAWKMRRARNATIR